MISEYRPLRILRTLTVSAVSEEELKRLYPHAVPDPRIAESAYYATYQAAKVIDVPTDLERETLTLKVGKLSPTAIEIPQHKDGFDIPTSNVARSRKGSAKGRQLYEIALGMERHQKKVGVAKRAKARMEKADAKAAKEKTASKTAYVEPVNKRGKSDDKGKGRKESSNSKKWD